MFHVWNFLKLGRLSPPIEN